MTYSIVARDRSTGELGVAVQSQAFNAGAAVPWARPGVGAVATQSFTDRRYGFRGLELLAAGATPDDALAQLRAHDEFPELRQVAMIDSTGRIAQWTGGDCVAEAGNTSGDGWAAQGNMLASRSVWTAMGEAFEHTEGALAQRLMSALEAAESEGGDWRGRGGAAIVVVPATGEPWERVFDLRVEEGYTSLTELRRLLERAESYRRLNRAHAERAALARSARLPRFHVQWARIEDALDDGDAATAQGVFDELVRDEPHWLDFARALEAYGHRPSLGPLLGE